MDTDILLSAGALYVFIVWALAEFSRRMGDHDDR